MARPGTGMAEGTLRWNQEEAIHANEVYFGLGLQRGTDPRRSRRRHPAPGYRADRIGNLWLAYNDTAAAGTVVADLDFTVTNPTFEALIGGRLSIAEKPVGAGGDAEATPDPGQQLDPRLGQTPAATCYIGTNRTDWARRAAS